MSKKVNLPTLLTRGKLVHPKLDIIPIDHIISVSKKMWEKTPESFADRMLIVAAPTGSGKSTTMPVFMFNSGFDRDILVVQPRVIAAENIALDISEAPYFPNMKIGVNLGYFTGPRRISPISSPNSLIYITSGFFAKQMDNWEAEDIFNKYSVIIVDEAHVRSQQFDLMVAKIKQLFIKYGKSKNFPLFIFTSATIDIVKFKEYFELKTHIEMEGLTFKITRNFLKEPSTDLVNSINDRINKILETKNDGNSDILVFLPGLGEIRKSMKLVTDENVLKLTINRAAVLKQTKDFKILNVPTKKRKIIFATDVAETSITISSLKYVIDAGLTKTLVIIYPNMLEGLITMNIEKSQALQRWGRVGRKFPGIVYPMYTVEMFNRMKEIQDPDIVTNGLNQDFLKLFKKKFDIDKLDLLDNPTFGFITYIHNIYNSLGIVDEFNLITELGEFYNEFDMSPQIAYFVYKSYKDEYSVTQISKIVTLLRNTRGENRFIMDEFKEFKDYNKMYYGIIDALIKLKLKPKGKDKEDTKQLHQNIIDSYKFSHTIIKKKDMYYTRYGDELVMNRYIDKNGRRIAIPVFADFAMPFKAEKYYTNSFNVVKKVNRDGNVFYINSPAWLF